jgi:predicted ATP-dependent endonuclease of OLD family
VFRASGKRVNTGSPDGDEVAMLLVSAKIGPFKSIEKPEEVKIEERVSVLVGMNESGKTVFLEALQKSDDIFDRAKFDYIDDYPRRNLSTYEKRHDTNPDTVTVLTYELTDKEAAAINQTLRTPTPHLQRASEARRPTASARHNPYESVFARGPL